jgi:hypothetical protein
MTNLLRDGLNNPWEEMIFPLSMLHPGSKVPHLAVVAIVGEPHLGTNEQDLPIVYNDTAVVNHVLVHHGPVIFLIKSIESVDACFRRTFQYHRQFPLYRRQLRSWLILPMNGGWCPLC